LEGGKKKKGGVVSGPGQEYSPPEEIKRGSPWKKDQGGARHRLRRVVGNNEPVIGGKPTLFQRRKGVRVGRGITILREKWTGSGVGGKRQKVRPRVKGCSGKIEALHLERLAEKQGGTWISKKRPIRRRDKRGEGQTSTLTRGHPGGRGKGTIFEKAV